MHLNTNLSEDDLIQQIGNDAVREAQRENLENGIPNVYSKNGVDYYQLPDGTITMQDPFAVGELKEKLDRLIAEQGRQIVIKLK